MEAAKSNARSARMQPWMLRITFIVRCDSLLAGCFAKMAKTMRQRDVLCDQQRERQKNSAENPRQGAHVRHTLQAKILKRKP